MPNAVAIIAISTASRKAPSSTTSTTSADPTRTPVQYPAPKVTPKTIASVAPPKTITPMRQGEGSEFVIILVVAAVILGILALTCGTLISTSKDDEAAAAKKEEEERNALRKLMDVESVASPFASRYESRRYFDDKRLQRERRHLRAMANIKIAEEARRKRDQIEAERKYTEWKKAYPYQ